MEQFFEFAGNHVVLVSALLLSFFLVVFTELRRKAMGVSNIEPQEAVRLINGDAVVLDLRSAEAFSRGHIVNAKNLPYDEIGSDQEKLERFKGKPIVAVCDAGITSAKLVATLRKAGMENVYSLRGGVNAWTQQSLPLVTAKKIRGKD
ncbi:MAG: rhodanese-like domain-containing protein [Gammaproteobacteria bacterium]|nr:rhodanese-like domain-containing protein [Gammaproteobacteria bacterium]MDH4254660.1 rhodanese-like domain-containing protein [Gammaproteobacteria bacterium]MDH5310042.1 rhodanese-like domain-containing protein [Gammaproteobacteria bacterium]